MELTGQLLKTFGNVMRMAVIGVLLAVLLQACGAGGNQPFSKASAPSGRASPPISVGQMNGLPQSKQQLMIKLLQKTAAKRDIAIVAQDVAGSWKLTGEFVRLNSPDGTVSLVYGWTLWDTKSRSVHEVSGAEPSGGDRWAAVTPNTMRRVASFTTESLSSRLAQLGFATQIGGISPPTHTYARAGPNAEKELDFETLYGPQTGSMSHGGPLPPAGYDVAQGANEGVPAGQLAADTPPVQEVQTANAAPTVKKAKKASDPNKQAIRGVAVTSVKGSPGPGNRELATAMRKVLKDAGWPVYKSPRPDALIITGDVDLGPRRGSAQKVALAWTIKSPGGKVLGTIKQANDVPAGSLDKGWGKTAGYAAEAGAQGIFDLINKLR